MAIHVEIGMMQQIAAATLHVVCVPRKKTVEKPNVAAMPAAAVKIPRIDGSLHE